MFCANCGAEVNGCKFCTNCGTPMNEELDVQAVEAEVAEEPAIEDSVEIEAAVEPVIEDIAQPETEEPVLAEIAAPAADDICTNCGAALEGRNFCVKCGASKSGAAPAHAAGDICKVCGAPLNGKNFCVKCGTAKSGAAVPAPAADDICKVCGAPLNGKNFCVKCGTAKTGAAPVQKPAQPVYAPVYTPAAPVQLKPEITPLKRAFGSGKFLVITIFMTLYILVSVLSSGSFSSDYGVMDEMVVKIFSYSTSSSLLLPVLIVIGLWITYISAKGSGKMSSAGLSIISGVLLVYNIFVWILFVLTALIGLIFLVIGIVMAASGKEELLNGFISLVKYGHPMEAVVIGVAILIAAGIMLIFILLLYRRLWKFAKSAAKSVKNETAEYKFAGPARRWLMFIGIVGIISAVIMAIVGLGMESRGIMFSGLSGLIVSIGTIIGSSWVKKNCVTEK